MRRASVFERMTQADFERVGEIMKRHELAKEDCAFYQRMKAVPRDAAWYDASPYEGDKHRYSAKFANPMGPQTVCGGAEPRPTDKNHNDQNLRAWAMVTGEFHARV